LSTYVYVGPFVRSEEEAKVQWMLKADDVVEISVSELSPATNYTLLVYAENSSGRSASAFIVYATTGGKQSQLQLRMRLSRLEVHLRTTSEEDLHIHIDIEIVHTRVS